MNFKTIILSTLSAIAILSCQKTNDLAEPNGSNEGDLSIQVAIVIDQGTSKAAAPTVRAVAETNVEDAILLVYNGIDASAELETKALLQVENSEFNQIKVNSGQKLVVIIVNPNDEIIAQMLGTPSNDTWTGGLEINSVINQLKDLTHDSSTHPITSKFTMVGIKSAVFAVDAESHETIPVSIPVSRIVAKVGVAPLSSGVSLPNTEPTVVYDLSSLIEAVSVNQISFNITQTPTKSFTYRLHNQSSNDQSATGNDEIGENKKFPNISLTNYSSDYKSAVANFNSLPASNSIYCPENINHDTKVKVGNSTFAVIKLVPSIKNWLIVSGAGDNRVLASKPATGEDTPTGTFYGYSSATHKRYIAPFKTENDVLAAINMEFGVEGELAMGRVKEHIDGACYYRLNIKDEVTLGEVQTSIFRVLPNRQYQITINSISEFGVASPEDLIPADGGLAHSDVVMQASINIQPWEIIDIPGDL